MQQIQHVALSQIRIPPNRKRVLREDFVATLAASIEDSGLLNLITARRDGGGIGFTLIAGHHRYMAVRHLGWETISAIVLDGIDAVRAELAEIDENLIRADLTPAELAAHHARRKELHEELHPETKNGGDRRSEARKSDPQNADLKSYTADAATKTGKSRDTVERAVRRGKDIPNVADLAGTSLDKGTELDALAKLREIAPERQAELIDRAKSGEKVSAKAEVKKVHQEVHEAEEAGREHQPVPDVEQCEAAASTALVPTDFHSIDESIEILLPRWRALAPQEIADINPISKIEFIETVKWLKRINASAEGLAKRYRDAGDWEAAKEARNIELFAARKGGQLLIEMKRRRRVFPERQRKGRRIGTERFILITALGINKHESSRWQKIAKLSEKRFQVLLDKDDPPHHSVKKKPKPRAIPAYHAHRPAA